VVYNGQGTKGNVMATGAGASAAPTGSILIVEDEAAARRLLRTTVQGLPEQYEIIEAPDGDSALEMARQRHPLLALVDIILPGSGVSGVLLCRMLSSELGIRVVVISGKASRAVVQSCLSMGAIAYVEKPFSVEGMRSQLAGWLAEGGE
jgi:CheY-like chemotaxis protein